MTQINIALGVTQNWMEYTRVTISSILLNSSLKDSYKFIIMGDEFSDEEKSLFLKLNCIREAEYRFIKMDDEWFEGAIHDWLGVASSYRLKLPSLVEEEKVLYLDSDIIVLKDIAELYNHDVSNYYIAAVEDKMSELMKPRVSMSAKDVFINGGVLLMNLKQFRENSLEKVIFELLQKSSFWTDQDVMNYVCREKTLSLPLKYNLMPINNCYATRTEEFKETMKNPFVLHYTEKPWKNPQVTYASYWLRYDKYLKDFVYSF